MTDTCALYFNQISALLHLNAQVLLGSCYKAMCVQLQCQHGQLWRFARTLIGDYPWKVVFAPSALSWLERDSASRLLLLAKDPKVPALLFRLLTRNCLLAGRVVGPDNLSSRKLHNCYGICWRR